MDGTEEEPSPSPLEAYIGQDLAERYEKTIMQLKESDRAAIFLRIELEMGHEEVADALNNPSAEAARKAVNRTLIRLAQEIEL